MHFAFAIGNENKGYKIGSEILFSSIPLTLVYKIDIHISTVLDQGGIGDGDIRMAFLGQTKSRVGQVPVSSTSGRKGQ